MPDISKSLDSFFNGLAKIITQVRKDKKAGIKAIILITMSLISLSGIILSAQNGAPYWAILVSAYAFLPMLYFIMLGCVKTDKRRRR
jgi:hypothetical protein